MEVKPSTIAWRVLATGVVAYDLLCPQGETLSEGVDKALERPVGRYIALGAIALTASHLANLIPEGCDPFCLALKAAKHVDNALYDWSEYE